MAIPFPGGWDPKVDGFGPMYEGPASGDVQRAIKKARKPRRESYTLWMVTKLVQSLATIAGVILLVKVTELMIIVAHLW